jgi:hypothetical protein
MFFARECRGTRLAEARRILSPKVGLLQQAAGCSTDSHNTHILKGLRADSILQDVAVAGSNVGAEHAPEHAPLWHPEGEINSRPFANP